MNLLPAVEAYIQQRLNDLGTHYPRPLDRIDELKMVLTLAQGLNKQAEFLEKTLEVPKNPETKVFGTWRFSGHE